LYLKYYEISLTLTPKISNNQIAVFEVFVNY